MKKLFLGLALCCSISVSAHKLSGIIGPGVYPVWQLSEIEKGQRLHYKFEFTRLSKGFGLDLRMGTGEGYSDYGGLFRLFHHFEFNPEESATGVSLGGGGGVMWSRMDSLNEETLQNNERTDVIAMAFARFLVEMSDNFGVALDLEYHFVPYTALRYGDPRQITEARHRLLLGLNLFIDFGI